MAKILLPKTFNDKFETNPHCKDKPKISYSQYTSYIDPEYQNDYYVQYFSGIEIPSGEFAEFGSSVGEYIEDVGNGVLEPRKGCLSEEDIKIIDEKVDYPPNCIYEDEIVIDLGDFCIEGYGDRCEYLDEKKVKVRDTKTLNIEKKSDFYASDEYGQTTLYCWKKEQDGLKVVESEVFGFGRKGTSLTGTGNYKMRLSGETVIIPTPYTKERGDKVIAKITETVHQISDDYKIFLKFFA